MPVDFDFLARLVTRNLQPGIGLGSSLSHSRLDAPRPIADPALGDQRKQAPAILRGRQTPRDPLRPQLHGVLEAQVTRVDAGIARGLRHQQPDQVVRQQMDPQLLLVHLRRLAAQHVHARGGLEVAQVQFDIPAPRIQRREIVLADLAMFQQRGDQHLVGDLDLAYRQFIGEPRVLLGRHPLRARRRLGPAHEVVSRAQRLAARRKSVLRAPFCSNSTSTPLATSVAI